MNWTLDEIEEHFDMLDESDHNPKSENPYGMFMVKQNVYFLFFLDVCRFLVDILFS